jgi:hypothetical protein
MYLDDAYHLGMATVEQINSISRHVVFYYDIMGNEDRAAYADIKSQLMRLLTRYGDVLRNSKEDPTQAQLYLDTLGRSLTG